MIFQTYKNAILRSVHSFGWILWLCFYPLELLIIFILISIRHIWIQSYFNQTLVLNNNDQYSNMNNVMFDKLYCDNKRPSKCESMFRWPKNVVTNIVFQNSRIFNSTKPILKEIFINYTQNKVVQLSNNAIVKEDYFLN